MLLEETDQSGTPQADYIYLNGRPIATLNPATGTLYYLQDDRLGTPQLATDSSQSVAWQAAYGPFGQASVSGSITQNLRFPGQYYDIETGWNHNGFRDYIPQLGRYAEPDPLAMQGSASFYSPGNGHLFSEYLLGFTQSHISPYAYVGNDPINLSDPLGLCPPKNNCPEKFKNFFSNINIYKNLAKRLNTKTLFCWRSLQWKALGLDPTQRHCIIYLA